MTSPFGYSLTTTAVDFAHQLSLDDIPAPVRRMARLHIADAIGVGMGASSLPDHRYLLATLLAQQPVGGQCSTLGFARTSTAPVAALLNGTSMHSLEFDDTHISSIVHGSSVIVPAALAAVEANDQSLDTVIRLVVLGWEILVRLGEASPGGFQQRGFQVTSVGGAPVAALLGAVAKGLSKTASISAMGIAGSQASGIFEFLSNGSNVKALHPGWAAQAGLWAADLAQGGMTGPATVLEGRFGLFNAYAADNEAGTRMQAGLESLGSEWRMLDAAFKLFPCCHYIHPYLECAATIRAEIGDAVTSAKILCKVAPGAAKVVCEPWQSKQRPTTPNEAKYSLPYCMARVLLGKSIDLDSMSDGQIDAEAIALAGRIFWEPRPRSPFPQKFDADVTVELPDGRLLHQTIDQVSGSAERPVSEDTIRAKFNSNVTRLINEDAANRVWITLLDGGSLTDLQTTLRKVHSPI